MYEDLRSNRLRFVIPGDTLWHTIPDTVQLLRQLDVSMPRFIRLAAGMALLQEYAPGVGGREVFTRLEAFLDEELRENSAQSYILMEKNMIRTRTVHRLVDAVLIIANNLRTFLYQNFGDYYGRHVLVEEVALPRLDVVISYATRDTSFQSGPSAVY